MDAYTQVLEFFMENGIQLNSNQIEELKDICNESGGAAHKLIDNRLDKANEYIDKGNDLNRIGTPKRKEEAESLWQKGEDILYTPIRKNKERNYETNPTTKDASDARIAADEAKGKNYSRNLSWKMAKQALGQGNMPKERKAGEYLEKQKMIDEYNKKYNNK